MTFETWRERARPLLQAGVDPYSARALLSESPQSAQQLPPVVRALKLPARLMRLLEGVSCFRADGRYELMYRLAWRTLFENRELLEDGADPDVRSARRMDAAVRRDIHKMHAFVRFREIAEEHGAVAYFAWFEPEHEILRRGAIFFCRRFANMKWTIATPQGAAMWQDGQLRFLPAAPGRITPPSDAHEDLWRTYYRAVCNIARLNPTCMQREMPKKYWRNLPEAVEIDRLVRRGRTDQAGRFTAAALVGVPRSKAVTQALAGLPREDEGPLACRRCDLWRRATQAVMGAGPASARLMLVGEQPGDEEDLNGSPFVGPAGRLLEELLRAARLERSELYITNAVKHFKWEARGKRRLHRRPNAREISACSLWLHQEVAAIKPRVVVALGATALQALTGTITPIARARGLSLSHARGARIIATYHPAVILRSVDAGDRIRDQLIGDLARAAELARVVDGPQRDTSPLSSPSQ